MEKLISKELLSEVLGKDVSDVSIVMNNINYVIENHETQEDDELVYIDLGMNINIYELAHRCKEWAKNQGYILLSKDKECLVYLIDDIYDVIECLNQYEDYFDADTEYEAIFKACDRILDNEVKYER